MKLLSEGEVNEDQVSWEDQGAINSFSILTQTQDEIAILRASKFTELEYLDDLSNELELADEDELIK